MRAHFASALLLTLAAANVSCSSSDTAGPGVDAGPGLDATGSEGGDDAGEDAADEADAAPTPAMVRFAQLSPDAPALDVCLALHGSGAYHGPLLAQFAEDAGLATDGGAPGLPFATVSAYFAVDAGTYDVRLVPAGATTCATVATATPDAGTEASVDAGVSADAGTGADAEAGASVDAGVSADAGTGAGVSTDAGADAGADASAGAGADASPGANTGLALLPPDTTDLAAFVAGGFTTVLLAGEVAPVGSDAAFRAVALPDDSALTSGGASLRAVNALAAVPEADFGYGSSSGSWLPLFTDVAFGAASLTGAASQGKPDDNGYLPISPFGPATFSVRASGDAGSDIASSQATAVASGTVATVIAAGGVAGDLAHPPVLVLCADNAPSGGWFAVCSILP